MVRKMLRNPVYLGHMVRRKEEKISFHEKTRELPENQWIVVRNTHEAIIKEKIFQEAGRGKRRSRRECKKENSRRN